MYPKALGLDICHFNIDSLIFSPMYQWDEQEKLWTMFSYHRIGTRIKHEKNKHFENITFLK